MEAFTPLVSIIVPVHNKANFIKATIDSIKSQTVNNLEAIIINDSSSDESEAIILAEIANDKRFRYEKVQFGNVALVRNYGFSLSSGTYICPLDGDDKIAPTFLEVCVKAMRADRSIAIAYTGLWYTKPNGEEGLSEWPGEWNFDKQLEGRNQIPTCNVAKREVWERLGGQRARYCAVLGAGSEDSEMWLRAGAYGFKAKKVTDEGLFLYSWMSGIVSGNSDYAEIDWRGMHPWVKDGLHPFASYATPKKFSHAVSQYDNPLVSVIIPVGPGHEKEVANALDSLEMQGFRKWEVVVVWDIWGQADNDAPLPLPQNYYLKSYPYIKFIDLSKTQNKSRGAGFARNRGVELARSPLIFFLDADDCLASPDALQKKVDAWGKQQSIIYSDYLGKAIWDETEARKVMGDRLLHYNKRTGTALFSKQSADYDPTLAQRQPEYQGGTQMPYYHWSLVSVLIPKAWHDAIGGFDESMTTWEDVDYHWRLARKGYCYYRIPEPLVIYNYHKGYRREASAVNDEVSLQKHKAMIQYINSKPEYQEKPTVCNCGGRKEQQQVMSSQQVAEMNDSAMVLIEFDFPGSSTRDTFGRGLTSLTKQLGPDSKVLDYKGYGRRKGDRFLVHVQDQRTRPDMFRLVQADVVLPEQSKVELAEPVLLVSEKRRGRPAKVAA